MKDSAENAQILFIEILPNLDSWKYTTDDAASMSICWSVPPRQNMLCWYNWILKEPVEEEILANVCKGDYVVLDNEPFVLMSCCL